MKKELKSKLFKMISNEIKELRANDSGSVDDGFKFANPATILEEALDHLPDANAKDLRVILEFRNNFSKNAGKIRNQLLVGSF